MEVTDPPPTSATIPARRPKRLRYLVAGGLCAAAIGYLVLGGLGSNIVYFRTVSEAVRAHQQAPSDTGRLRMAGAVVTGTVHRLPGGDGVAFDVTEGGARASVVHHGDPPELFKDGAPVVCEGRWRGTSFESDRIMIKHGADYRPPAVDPAPPGAGR